MQGRGHLMAHHQQHHPHHQHHIHPQHQQQPPPPQQQLQHTRMLSAPPPPQPPPMSQANMNMGMSMGVRMRRNQTGMQVQMPPMAMHRPPMHHHVQHQTQMVPAQTMPVTTHVPPPMGVLTTTPPPSAPPMTNSNSNVVFSTQKSITPPIAEDGLLSEADIISETSSKSGNGNKEKTPMCLVNELARFNKIQHQYRLTSEQGPAHRRRFTVALRLGGNEKDHVEEYTAEAARIRTAQHAVAAEALRCTSFPLPPPRPPKALRKQGNNGPEIVMPTVELNALVMKLGEPAVYKIERNNGGFPMHMRSRMGMQPAGGHPLIAPPNVPVSYNRNGRYFNQNNRFPYPYKYNNGCRDPNMPPENFFRVELTIGKLVFHGKGMTLQAARNDAASQALVELKQTSKDTSGDEKDSNPDNENDDKNDDKSPVSMVHELALKLELPAAFSVKNEKGPPHMKVFTTVCSVGELITEGEGNSKKISKKRAAENMLEKLKKLPSYKAQPKVQKPKRKTQPPKKKTRNLIKEKSDNTTVSEQNPVSRLQQWANHRSGGGGTEPVYSLKVETNGQFRRNFVIECEVANRIATGTGTNKKIAKRNAAENMLIELGLGKTQTISGTSKPGGVETTTVDKTDASKSSPRKVTFSVDGSQKSVNEGVVGASSATGRQLVPGVLLMQDHLASVGGHFKTPTKNGVNIQTTATIAKELLRAGKSPTAEALAKQDNQLAANTNPKPISSSVVSSTTGGSTSQISQVIRPKDQLMYLAQLLGFQVQFSDFPKGNHGEYLSLVTLSTEPPMLCHGGGLTTEESHDQSARAALEHLSQMGLDNVTPHPPTNHSSDGIRMMNSSNGTISGILTNGISK